MPAPGPGAVTGVDARARCAEAPASEDTSGRRADLDNELVPLGPRNDRFALCDRIPSDVTLVAKPDEPDGFDGGGTAGEPSRGFPAVHAGSTREGVMVDKNPEQEQLLTPSEVAAMFRVNPKTVTRWARSGKISAIRTLGGHRRFRASEIRQFLEQVDEGAEL